LDLNGHQEGVTVYDQVDDIDKSLKSLVDPEAKTVQEIKDVGAGRLIASVQGENGNIIEVLQDR
jgi:predicted enzyme related to lactoylglutathione lyase